MRRKGKDDPDEIKRKNVRNRDLVLIITGFLVLHFGLYLSLKMNGNIWENDRVWSIFVFIYLIIILVLSIGLILLARSFKWRFLVSTFLLFETSIGLFIFSILLKSVSEASQAMAAEGSSGFGSMEVDSLDFHILINLYRVTSLIALILGILLIGFQIIYLIYFNKRTNIENAKKPKGHSRIRSKKERTGYKGKRR